MKEKGADWICAYSRKSRHLDKDMPEAELFRQHRLAMERKAIEIGVVLPADRILMEVGSSERLDERPVLTAILEEVDRRPLGSRGHLIIPDQDRLTRGDELERALIYTRLRRAGIVLHQVTGGECDLNNMLHDMMRQMKGVVSRWLIEEYKAKVAGVRHSQIEKGEVRYGNVPWGYWWDKSEKLSRRRIKPDTREERRVHAGLTPFEALQRCCEESLFVSLRILSDRYQVSYDTLRTTLATPTICGYPCRKSRMEMSEPKSRRQKKLPRDEWTWPKQAGEYPVACSREHWYRMRDAIHARHDSRVHRGHGVGISRDVVRFEGMDVQRVELTTTKQQKTHVPGYRCTGKDGRQIDVARDVVDEAAKNAVRDLVADADFFVYMIQTYYQQRKADPEPIHEEVRRLESQLRQWKRELATLTRLAREATLRTLQDQYSRDAHELARLIEAKEEEREAAFHRRSPIPDVDQAVPVFLALRRRVPPEAWAECWDDIWAKLDCWDQRRLVRLCLEEIPVRYHQRVKHGRGTREILPVVYSAFVQQAMEAWRVIQDSRACNRTVSHVLNDYWEVIAAVCAA